jgi:hypothetical protein
VSTCSIPVAVAVVLLLLALVVDVGMQFPVVFVVVFFGLFVLFNRRRSLELGPRLAVRRGAPSGRSMARAEVRSVSSGPWWRGGIVLAGPGRSLWAPVGDRPLGYVSAARLRIVQAWAVGTPDHDQ